MHEASLSHLCMHELQVAACTVLYPENVRSAYCCYSLTWKDADMIGATSVYLYASLRFVGMRIVWRVSMHCWCKRSSLHN